MIINDKNIFEDVKYLKPTCNKYVDYLKNGPKNYASFDMAAEYFDDLYYYLLITFTKYKKKKGGKKVIKTYKIFLEDLVSKLNSAYDAQPNLRTRNICIHFNGLLKSV